jgi:hypothetical protein
MCIEKKGRGVKETRRESLEEAITCERCGLVWPGLAWLGLGQLLLQLLIFLVSEVTIVRQLDKPPGKSVRGSCIEAMQVIIRRKGTLG